MTASVRYAPRRMTPKLRDEILNSGPCHYCGHNDPGEVEHLIPVSRGGSDDRENLVPACWRCNQQKGSKTPDEWQAWRAARGLSWPPGNITDWRWLAEAIEWLFTNHPAEAETLNRGFRLDREAAVADRAGWWDRMLHDETTRMVHGGTVAPEVIGGLWLARLREVTDETP